MDSIRPALSKEEKSARRLETIKKNRKCKMLPADATAQELLDAHKTKMAAKKLNCERMHKQMTEDFREYKEWESSENEKRQHIL